MVTDLDTMVSAALTGSRLATECVLRTIQPWAVRYCRARIGQRQRSYEQADELARQVCQTVLTTLRTYQDHRGSFLAFVYEAAARAVDAYRHPARSMAQRGAAAVQLVVVEPAEPAGQMARLLSRLPPSQREIMVLRVAVGLSTQQTADALGCTPGAVRVAQHRALDQLRKAMAAEATGTSS